MKDRICIWLNVDLHITSSVNVFISPEPDVDSPQLRGGYLDGTGLGGEVC